MMPSEMHMKNKVSKGTHRTQHGESRLYILVVFKLALMLLYGRVRGFQVSIGPCVVHRTTKGL